MDDKKTIDQKVLERIFKDNHDNGSDTRFIFLLGAGSSVQSDIPSAYKLATGWIKDIKNDLTDDEYLEWLKDKNINEDNLASSYTEIYTKRFEHNPKNGYETLQKLMENKEPSIGYTILSQILEGTNHNFVITTNFDSLIEDALFLFTSKRPLVCGHESLADFIQLNSTRPTIIKVHRDILLNPYNTPDNTCNMEEPLKKALKPILENSPMVILGYGGHDESVLNLLKEPNRQPIYWCVRDTTKVSDNIKDSLTNEADRIVKIDGFDEFMVALQSNVYDFQSIKSLSDEDEHKSLIVKNALEKVKIYKKELEKFQKEVQSSTSEEFKKNSKSVLPSWWDYQLAIDEESEVDKKDELYKNGINEYNSPELMGNYANFLYIENDYDNAEIYYKKSLDIDASSANTNGNYALFLSDIRKDFNKSEKYFLIALDINPNHININGSFANFLYDRKEYDEANKYYLKVVELDPSNVNYIGDYASFLSDIKGELDKAEEYYLRVLNIDPLHKNNNGNYANFLLFKRYNYKKAENYYLKALKLDPYSANKNGNYANLLILTNRIGESIEFIEKAFSYYKEEEDLILELWFYKLAHFPDDYQESKDNLDKYLEMNFKSDGWDFSLSIKKAIENGNKNIDELKDYATKISGLDYLDI